MSNKEIAITNYDELIRVYESKAKQLKDKKQESYWLRYLFRRIPLFAGLGLIFFGICLALATTESVGMQKIEIFLANLKPYSTNWHCGLFLGSTMSLIFLFIIVPWFTFHSQRNKIEKAEKTKENILREELKKISALILMFCMFISGLFWVLASEFPQIWGLSLFGTVTLGALIIDRTLGFTRRNERYALFAERAESLGIINRSKKAMEVPFGEQQLQECAVFFDQLRQDKHTATVSDSFFILRQPKNYLGS